MTATTLCRIATLPRRPGLPACTTSECVARLGRDRRPAARQFPIKYLASRKPARSRPVGNHPSERRAKPGDDVVDSVEDAGGNTGDHAAEATREPHRLEELRATRAVADERAVAERKAPRREPLLFGQPGEKRCGLGIA